MMLLSINIAFHNGLHVHEYPVSCEQYCFSKKIKTISLNGSFPNDTQLLGKATEAPEVIRLWVQ